MRCAIAIERHYSIDFSSGAEIGISRNTPIVKVQAESSLGGYLELARPSMIRRAQRVTPTYSR